MIAQVNPLTYEVDALRALMIAQGTSTYGIAFDLSALVVAAVVLVIVAAKVYPNVAR